MNTKEEINYGKELPAISKRTFWDIDISKINFQESYEWVIHRVFDRGTLKEVLTIVKYYGFDFVKDVITKTTTFMPNHSILLSMAIFKLKISDFRCLEKRPFLMNY